MNRSQDVLPKSEPTRTGSYGKAWEVDYAGYVAKHPDINRAHLALTVCGWLVHAPWAHPAWHSYMVACVSLRELEGADAPKIALPGATHEVMVYALNPDEPMLLDDSPALLVPGNFHGQFIEPSDDAARARVADAVQRIVDGLLNPDTDARAQWVSLFGAANMRKGWDQPDHFIVSPDGSTVAVGTGAAMATALAVAGIPVQTVDPKATH